MRLLISGSSGFVGKALVTAAKKQSWQVIRLLRQPPPTRQSLIINEALFWDPQEKILDPETLENFDVIIHLGGSNLASGRWTRKRKEKLYNSRIDSSRLLSETIAKLKSPPKIFICASAVGYYGDRGIIPLSEDSPPGMTFLAELCRHWELASQRAEQVTRVIHCRLGIVIGPHGGVIAKLKPLFGLGLGAVLGSGHQYISWISLEDAVSALLFLSNHPDYSGPVNLCAAEPVTQQQFAKGLAKSLSRPLFFKIPGFMLKLFLGQMAKEMLLQGQRVAESRLHQLGFHFKHKQLSDALLFLQA